MDADPALDPSAWPSLLASVAPIAIGATAVHLRLFVEPESEFRKRISLRRKDLIEQVAARHASLLQHVRGLTDDDDLRGDGRESPDLVGDLAKETHRLFRDLYAMQLVRHLVRTAYFLLYLTIGLGMLGVLLTWVWSSGRTAIVPSAVLVAALQMLLVYAVMRASRTLEEHEDAG